VLLINKLGVCTNYYDVAYSSKERTTNPDKTASKVNIVVSNKCSDDTDILENIRRNAKNLVQRGPKYRTKPYTSLKKKFSVANKPMNGRISAKAKLKS